MRGAGIMIVPLLLAANALAAEPIERAIERARADAARRLAIAAESIEIVSAEAVTWPDGSLGCPRPGMAYTQALVPGYRIRLRAQDQVLDYHAGRKGMPLLCPASRSVDPVPDSSN